jgi:hypothetical protein
MKSQRVFVLTVIVAAFAGVAVGVAYTQANTGTLGQGDQRPPLVLPRPLGDVNTNAQQQSKPELEIQSGDSETIKALKTELKELRQRVDRLEYETKPRKRPAAQP